jgi:hypothetical protein
VGIERIRRNNGLQIYEGTSPPQMTNVIWIDTSTSNHKVKVYDSELGQWIEAGVTSVDEIVILATQVQEDTNHRFVTDAQIAFWSDHYTQAEVDQKLSALQSGLNWKPTVPTFDDIATTYPNPEDGWTVNVQDNDYTYRYDAQTRQWIPISANSIPLATPTVDGKMSAADKAKLDRIPDTIVADMSNKADKVANATAGHFAALDANGNLVDSGYSNTSFAPSSQMALKADKVQGMSPATAGNFAGLDQYGNLTNSGYNASSFAPATLIGQFQAFQTATNNALAGKMNKVTGARAGNFVALDVNGNAYDSGYNYATFAPADHTHALATHDYAGFMSPADKMKLDSFSGTWFSVISDGTNSLIASSAGDEILFIGSGAVNVSVGDSNQVTINVDPNQFAPSSHVGSGGNAHALATQTTAGFMSPEDKAKLDSIQVVDGHIALNDWYTFAFVDSNGTPLTGSPVSASQVQDTFTFKQGQGVLFVVDSANKTVQIKLDFTQTATTSSNGFMSSADKTKLNSIGNATATTPGLIQLAGVLTGTATNPTLTPTGVQAGTYSFPTITVGADGRITNITDGTVNLPQATSSSLGTIQLSGVLTGTATNVQLNDTGVTAGTYNVANVTVGADGRITSISSAANPSDLMLKSVYDRNDDGRVDNAEHALTADTATTATQATNADKLGNNPPSYYQKAISISSSTPSSPQTNDLWVNTSSSPILMYYDGTQWNPIGGSGGGGATISDNTISTTTTWSSQKIQTQISALINDSTTSTSATWSSQKIQTQLTSLTLPWSQITGKPSSTPSQIDTAVSQSHTHSNKAVLDGFSVSNGQLQWSGMKVGDMAKSVYDTNGDGIVNVADTLNGLTATIQELNYVHGVRSNIQEQIDTIAQSVVWKGHVSSYASISSTFPTPMNGWMIVVDADEQNGGHKTLYIYNSSANQWQFIGSLDYPPNASSSSVGLIKLAGDLTGTATNPQLTPTGVAAGTYSYATVQVDSKGRVVQISQNPTPPYINDSITSTTSVWSSNLINNLLNQKLNVNDPRLHYANQLGTHVVDETNIADGAVLTYSASQNKLVYTIPPAQTTISSQGITMSGNVNIAAGQGVTIQVDTTSNTITINSSGSSGGGSGGGSQVPTYVERSQTVTVPAGQSVPVAINVGFDKFDVRSVSASSDNNMSIMVEIWDRANNGQLVYRSLQQQVIYDIPNVPMQDKDGTQSAHFVVYNYGMSQTNVTITLKITNLQ